MVYSINIKPTLDSKLNKLAKKNKKQYEIILKKVQEIIQNPQHYKNLHKPLQHWKRVHIDSHFVLTFSVDENTKTVTLEEKFELLNFFDILSNFPTRSLIKYGIIQTSL